MDLLLDLPMLTDQAQLSYGISLGPAEAGDAMDHVVALLPALLHDNAALHRGRMGASIDLTS